MPVFFITQYVEKGKGMTRQPTISPGRTVEVQLQFSTCSTIKMLVALFKDEWSMSRPSCFTSDIHLIRVNKPQGSFSHDSWKKVYAPSWESSSASSLVTRETEPSTQWHNTHWYQIRWCRNNIVFVITLHYTQIYKKKHVIISLWLFLPTLNV